MKTTISLLIAALIAGPALAEPWGSADPKAGHEHHEKACVACHVRLYGGDGSKMYTREGRLLMTQLDVLQRVATCNSQVRAGWFPEEEAEVAAYLNQQYYRFKD
ncbi:cytochrome c [Dechloromonas sp. HYN0024]|jgi:hypothetical protein|uniref:cytochrome c n=1 Tax=Dechloromonas sp. HYN0024 TaxID=2231055 RepID=UPI000E4421BF|nr:cytochrome c [Dechloromonas sp. HYN0024]AXS79464.1 cytochrome c [Dechloromonas sp. HYN0024]